MTFWIYEYFFGIPRPADTAPPSETPVSRREITLWYGKHQYAKLIQQRYDAEVFMLRLRTGQIKKQPQFTR